jgi:hypothetical protein
MIITGALLLIDRSIKNFNPIKKIDLISMKTPLTGTKDHFIFDKSIVPPNTINGLVIPPGSISLYKISN